jgi:hypothetical protein
VKTLVPAGIRTVIPKWEAINLSSLMMGVAIIFMDQAVFGVFSYVEEYNRPSVLTVTPLFRLLFRWTYGLELWGCSTPSNTKILQSFQSKTLRKLANAPWYISNMTLHNDLRIPYVTEVIRT